MCICASGCSKVCSGFAADDLRQLADHLDVQRFYVAGMSGGGPYALAAAHYLQGRILGATVNCSAASVGASWDLGEAKEVK